MRSLMTVNGVAPGVWTLPDGELCSIGRAFHLALVEAGGIGAPLPSDEHLDAQLRARGCAENQLDYWRERVRQIRFAVAFESAAIVE
jgi:hypothetical protein